ncbi:helix-turn-helix domain-containing protein [Edaphobacter aggregans]|uniref:helix-turn-helix domain-containing protein n=1 Tax=Edaphobacter aggregans TaxID=570835 RepID=UPI000551333D|nr:helix-turn-helix transcriptional regulator [Edaphobacter aggregans]
MRKRGSGSPDEVDKVEFVRQQLWNLQKLSSDPYKHNVAPDQAGRSIKSGPAVARVVAHMHRHALNQEAFAEAAGISSRTLRTILRNQKARRATWVQIAKAMGTTAEELLLS